MQQGVQTDASCNIQQCWELLPTKSRPFGRGLRLRANGRHIVDQQLPTLFNVTCCVRLHILFHVVGYCCVLLRKVGNRSNFSANNSQPFFLFHDRRRVAQQCGISCWIRLHSSSNINGARHAHYAWFTKTYELYPTHDALQVPTLLGVSCIRLQTTANTHATTPNNATMLGVVASVCTQPKTSNFLPVQPQNRAKSFSYIFRCCLPFKNLHGPAGSVQVPLRLNERWIRASLCRCPFKNLSKPVNGV